MGLLPYVVGRQFDASLPDQKRAARFIRRAERLKRIVSRVPIGQEKPTKFRTGTSRPEREYVKANTNDIKLCKVHEVVLLLALYFRYTTQEMLVP